MTTEATKNKDDSTNHVADLYWLAFLLTGRQHLSIEIASDTAVSGEYESPFFSDWMRGWQRRLVIGRALTAIHAELSDSARRTQLARVHGLPGGLPGGLQGGLQGGLPAGWPGGSAEGSAMLQRNWSLDPGTTKADLEKALLSIDLFPRAALLLLVFEGLRMADAATLLDADPALIRKAQAIGLRALTANLAEENSSGDQHGSKPAKAASKKFCFWLRTTAVCH